MKYDTNDYTGSIEILDGHPVPFTATIQRRKMDGQLESVPAVQFLSEISDWLAAKHYKLLRIEGSYIYYTPKPQPYECHH